MHENYYLVCLNLNPEDINHFKLYLVSTGTIRFQNDQQHPLDGATCMDKRTFNSPAIGLHYVDLLKLFFYLFILIHISNLDLLFKGLYKSIWI